MHSTKFHRKEPSLYSQLSASSRPPQYKDKPARRRLRVQWPVVVLVLVAIFCYYLLSQPQAAHSYEFGHALLQREVAASSLHQQVDGPINPLNVKRKLSYDSDLSFVMPDSIRARERSQVRVICAHKNITHCPNAYRVWFTGPTILSPSWAQSSTLIDTRTVQIDFDIVDPGVYYVYAWPEHTNCDEWVDSAIPR